MREPRHKHWLLRLVKMPEDLDESRGLRGCPGRQNSRGAHKSCRDNIKRSEPKPLNEPRMPQEFAGQAKLLRININRSFVMRNRLRKDSLG